MSDVKVPRLDYPWTHRKKGGHYVITSLTSGAGELHGRTLVHYRQISIGGGGPVYSRLLDEWHSSMQPLEC
jgi:hypothetical protein